MTRPALFVGLGSNLGDRAATLDHAAEALARVGIRVRRCSSLYETQPIGGPPQGWFLNQVIEAESDLTPEETLGACLEIETALGRTREVHYGPRTIDLDVLLYGREIREGPVLTLPHPRLHERRFVLVPLCEIAPQARHPVLGLSATEMLERCADRSEVRLHTMHALRR